jgi:DNA-binding CsgD family transcriptional regulator
VTSVLFGRSGQIELLAEALARASRGEVQLATIEGAAGIGKSALVDHVAMAAHERGFLVVECITDEFNGVRPFGPLIDGFRKRPELVEASVRIRALLEAPGDGFSPILMGIAPSSRESVIEAVCQMIEELLLARAILLIVEDVHWADDATLETIRRLSKGLRGYPLFFLVTSRPITTYTAALWGSVRNEGSLEIDLVELSDAESIELVSAELGYEVGDNLRSLVTSAGGNPLLLHDVVHAVSERGFSPDAYNDVALSSIPSSLIERTRKTLRTLSHEQREVIQIASVLGTVSAIADVANMIGSTIGITRRVVVEAQRSGLLRLDGESLCFEHEMFRAAVEDSIAEPERVFLNRAAARMLIARNASGALVSLHLDRGKLAEPFSQETEQMLAAWLVRSAAEVKTQAPSLAIDLLDKARLSDPELFDRPETQLIRLEAAAHSGRLQLAEEVGESLLRADLDPSIFVDASLWLGACHMIQQRSADAARRFHEAVPKATPQQAALLTAYRALALVTAFDANSNTVIDEAIELSKISENKPAMTLALGLKSRVLANNLHHEKSLTFSQASCQIALSDKSDDSQRHVPMLFHSLALFDLDRHQEAQTVAEAGRKKSEVLGALWSQAIYHGLFALLYFTNGQVEDAEAEARAGATAAEEVGSKLTVLWCLTVLAYSAIERGDLSDARRWIGLGEKNVASGDSVTGVELLMTAKSRMKEVDGDLVGAHANLQETWELFHLLDFPVSLLAICPDAMRLAFKTSDSKAITRISAFLEKVVKENASPRAAAYVRAFNELSIDRTAKPDLAIAELRRLGRHMEASVFAELHLPRTDHAMQAALGPLSTAERRVAELVGEGLSNKAIAQDLGISRRTVETHVGRVLRKLNVESRVQLALVLQEHTNPA